MAEHFENLLYDVRERTAWVTINRPAKLNALDRATMAELGAALERATGDDAVAVIVLTGAGEKAFVAGADIGEMSRMSALEGQQYGLFLQRTLERIERSQKPVVAAVNGFALGGGCELAMACHLRFAADSARFGQPEVNLGLIPGAGGTQRLQRLVGRGRALELILGGEMIHADEALRIGLVNRVLPAAELATATVEFARLLSSKSPLALARAIEAIVSGGEIPQVEALRLEAALFGLCFATEDMREGTQAFLDKRRPEFPGH